MPSIAFHVDRRERAIEKMQPNSIAIFPANRLQTRSRDTEYDFRQNSDFWYLTGFPEPDAWLIMSNSEQFDGNLCVLGCLPKDPEREIWQGRRIGPDNAKIMFEVDHTFSIDELELALLDLIDGHEHLYFALGEHDQEEALILDVISQLRSAPKQSKKAPTSILDPRPFIHEMRLFKTPEELDIMRQAADISAKAHCVAMQNTAHSRYEYQLEADIKHVFARNGARNEAYSSIVGSGENACILHYTENSSPLKNGELVLIDAGAEFHGYAADITRTFPVGGKFSKAQATIYQLVLDSQLAALSQLKPGNTLSQATSACLDVLVKGLINIGILSGEPEQLIAEKSYQPFFMHGLGHWLGLDVHDVGDYKIDGRDRPLMANMVLTVEPGLYFMPGSDVPEQYQGIGVRIEDDIVITENGNEILTHRVPKTISEIESLMATEKTVY